VLFTAEGAGHYDPNMDDDMASISQRSVRLIVVLLGVIAMGLAAVIVVLLTRDGGTEVATQDTSPATGTIIEEVDPAGPSVPANADPGGDSVPDPTPVPPSMSLEQLANEVGRLWPSSISAQLWGADFVDGWDCVADTDGALVGGSVATCRPDPPVEEGQHPVVTVLVLDGAGRVAVAEAGVQNPDLAADAMAANVESGLNCTKFTKTDPGPASIDDQLGYFAAVLYWFLEGRPSPLMDIDENGIPCETKYTSNVVDALWRGGWLPPAPPTPAGQPVDGLVENGDVLSVFGVAHDDTLNIRARPGTDQVVVAELAPTDQVVATGEAWDLGNSTWYEVETGPGWVNSEFVAFAVELSFRIWREWNLSAESLAELGQLVVDRIVSELVNVDSGRHAPSRTVVSVAPTENSIGYDIVGFGDDAVPGARIYVLAERNDTGDYVNGRVETTAFCAYGVEQTHGVPTRCLSERE
jgi:hypothetical protein